MIDEVSMLGSDLFTKLAAIGAAVRGCAKPFGGIQVRTHAWSRSNVPTPRFWK
jgi:hypothetical protein